MKEQVRMSAWRLLKRYSTMFKWKLSFNQHLNFGFNKIPVRFNYLFPGSSMNPNNPYIGKEIQVKKP